MNIYTKNGDKGTTDLVRTKNVSKSDDRIGLVGTIDELTSHIGVVKTLLTDGETIRMLEKIQETLITVMAGVAEIYSSGRNTPFCRDRCGAHSCKKSGEGACICWREIRSRYRRKEVYEPSCRLSLCACKMGGCKK